MAAIDAEGAARSKQKYRGWLTIRRSKPSKKKYNVQDAIPHNSPIPDENTNGKVIENDDEDVPTLIQRLKVSSRLDGRAGVPGARVATVQAKWELAVRNMSMVTSK